MILATGTYKELVGVTVDQGMKSMHKELQAMAAPFRRVKGLHTFFTFFYECHEACLQEPILCPLYLLSMIHKPGMEVRPIVPNLNYFACQASTFLHHILESNVFRNQHVLTIILIFDSQARSSFMSLSITSYALLPLTSLLNTRPSTWNVA